MENSNIATNNGDVAQPPEVQKISKDLLNRRVVLNSLAGAVGLSILGLSDRKLKAATVHPDGSNCTGASYSCNSYSCNPTPFVCESAFLCTGSYSSNS